MCLGAINIFNNCIKFPWFYLYNSRHSSNSRFATRLLVGAMKRHFYWRCFFFVPRNTIRYHAKFHIRLILVAVNFAILKPKVLVIPNSWMSSHMTTGCKIHRSVTVMQINWTIGWRTCGIRGWWRSTRPMAILGRDWRLAVNNWCGEFGRRCRR